MTLDRSPTLSGGEWIDWAGGACPVPDDAPVMVRYRDGLSTAQWHSARTFVWGHVDISCRSGSQSRSPCLSDIVAYRVVAK